MSAVLLSEQRGEPLLCCTILVLIYPERVLVKNQHQHKSLAREPEPESCFCHTQRRYHPVPVGRHCNWTAPVPTDIPDSHSRACAAPLPDGRIFLIGAQIPTGRDPVVLSISRDGLEYRSARACFCLFVCSFVSKFICGVCVCVCG